MIWTISQTLWLKCPLEPSPRPNTSLLHSWSLFMGASGVPYPQRSDPCRNIWFSWPPRLWADSIGPIQGKSERHVRTKTFDGQFSSDLNQSLLCSKLLRWLGWSRAFSAVGIHDPTPCHSFLESWWIAANHNNPNTYISSGKDSKWKSVQRYARQNWKRFTFGRPSHPPLQSELFVL